MFQEPGLSDRKEARFLHYYVAAVRHIIVVLEKTI
jgi:hypothetical protein